MKSRPSLKSTDLIYVLLVLAGILIFWTGFDPKGYLLYSGLIMMTLSTVVRQFKNKDHEFKYPKGLLIIVVLLITLTGIDRMTLQQINSMVFPLCYILYILIQPKPAWIIRP